MDDGSSLSGMSINENKVADVFAIIMGMTRKCREYTRPMVLASRFMNKKE